MKITQEKWDKVKEFIKQDIQHCIHEMNKACTRKSRAVWDMGRQADFDILNYIESLEKEER